MSALRKNLPNAKLATSLFFLLICFGLVMLASAGVVEGQKRFDSSSYYLIHQILYGVLPGLIIFYFFSRMKYERWRTLALPLLVLAVVMLIAVFIPSLGVSIKGAQRWLDLKFATVQPAEFLKFALVVYLAAWFGTRDKSGHGALA